MSSTVVFLAVLSLQFPSVQAIQPLHWKPAFVPEPKVEICSETVGFYTHCSWAFDPLGATKPGVDRSVQILKSAGWPVIYFHDRHNPNNPAWCYLYNDWQPTAYVSSDIGHFQIDLTGVEHAVCHGGYFGQCERATVGDVIRNWQRTKPRSDLRITQVVDATFTVAQFLPDSLEISSEIRARLREQQRIHPKAVITLEEVIRELRDPILQVEYVKRQLPALPFDVNVVIDLGGEVTEVKRTSKDSSTLTFAYCRSEDVLNFRPVSLEWPAKQGGGETQFPQNRLPIQGRRVYRSF